MGSKKPFQAVLLIQSLYAGMFLVSKAAFNVGMNNFIFVFYRQAAATVFLVPLSIIFERKNVPPLSFVTFCKIFMLSLFGITLSLDINGVALIYTSATLAAATTNCLPVITFFLAVLLRMERVKLRTSPGMAKIAGVLICMAGAATIAFYKGPHLQLLLHHPLFGHSTGQQHQSHVSSSATWVKGCLLMLMSNTFWGLWLVLQARIIKSYPAKLMLTTLQCLLSSIQSFFIAIAFERDLHQWKLGWNVKLIAVAYTGIVVTGGTYYLQTWVIEKKGPVFLAMSTPFALVITIICSATLLGEAISLGSILGGILLVGGLYSVLWGKSTEQRMEKTSSIVLAEKETELKEEAASQSPPPPFFVVKLRTSSGMAKITGVLIYMAGAATIAFYKGPHLQLLLHHRLFGHSGQEHQSHVSSDATWVKGCLLMPMSNTLWGLWFVLQARIIKSCPAKLLFTTLCLLSSILSFFITIALERNLHQWKLGKETFINGSWVGM